MKLNDALFSIFEKKAKHVLIDTICIGLGYTIVTTSDGGIGLSYTLFETKSSCSMNKGYIDYEGNASIQVLENIKSSDPIKKSVALALVNALNHENALRAPVDRKQKALFEKLGIGKGTNVAMVGFFGPMMKYFRSAGAVVNVMDDNRQIGNRTDFYTYLETEADVLVLTSTSILNNTTEEILAHASEKLKTVMLGPSTPLIAEAFKHLPVNLLAGTVVLDKDNALKAVRHGTGTPVIQKFGRKSYLEI